MLPRCSKESAGLPQVCLAPPGCPIAHADGHTAAPRSPLSFHTRAVQFLSLPMCSLMLRKILLLLGETPSSVSARRYAIDLAASRKAQLTGFTAIDTSIAERPMPGRIGAASYSAAMQTKVKGQAEGMRKRLNDIFARECAGKDIQFESSTFEGDPLESVIAAVEGCDLVITGHDTGFRGGVRERPSELVMDLLMMMPRPLIIASDELEAGDGVMVAYDGSPPAMRAVQIFALLGLGLDQRVHVVSSNASRDLAARRVSAASGYLVGHGYQIERLPVVSDANPAKALSKEIFDRNIRTMVMGAFGQRGFRQLLFGSTTRALLENPPCALFVYH
jgi:nucleotide-binding universal stress UspA family protein